MTTELVKEELRRFVADTKPGVISLVGKWGVGKTFTWNKWLTEEFQNKLGLEKYAYASLFGLNSLADVKLSISQAVKLNSFIRDEFDKNSIWSTKQDGLKWLMNKASRIVPVVPYAQDLNKLIEAASFNFCRNTLICIDDFERKSDNITTKDILGLVTKLRDEMGCQIILIMNDEKVDGDDDLQSYHEKSVDITLRYAPTPAEAIDIAFAKGKSSLELAAKHTKALNIRNIRLLKKIERLVIQAEEELKGFEVELLNQAIVTLVLLVACKYSDDPENIPSYDFISRGYSERSEILATHKAPSDEEERWSKVLSAYGFGHLDELDHILKSFVDDGYLNRPLLKHHAEKLDRQVKTNKLDKAVSSAWKLYHESLDNNEVEVVEALTTSFKKAAKNITPFNANGLVNLLRDLGHDDKAEEIIAHYVGNIDDPDVFAPEKYASFGDISDRNLKQAFEEKHEKLSIDPNFNAAAELFKISKHNSWGPKQLNHLSKMNSEEYVKMFKENANDTLSSIIKAAQLLGNVIDIDDPKFQLINDAVSTALQTIAEESPINERRMIQYGVVVKVSALPPPPPRKASLFGSESSD